jgi:cell division protein ZapA
VSTVTTVKVSILDNDYQVACPAEQKGELLRSAHYLDQQMRAIRKSGKVIGLERIAVMAALNISHELLKTSECQDILPKAATAIPDDGEFTEACERLHAKLDAALQQLRQLEIN